jgi:hypothetical protein
LYPIVISGDAGQEDPQWWSETALVGEEFVAKFAWSRLAAFRVGHEIGVLAALARAPASTSPTTARRPTGSTTWPPASAPSASTRSRFRL